MQRIQENVRTRTSFAVPQKITELELTSICQNGDLNPNRKTEKFTLNIEYFQTPYNLHPDLNKFSKVAFVLVDVKQPVITNYVFVNESVAVIQPFKFSQ